MAWKCLKSKKENWKNPSNIMQPQPPPTAVASAAFSSSPPRSACASTRQLPRRTVVESSSRAAAAPGVKSPDVHGENGGFTREKLAVKHMYAAKIKSWRNKSVDFTGLTNNCVQTSGCWV